MALTAEQQKVLNAIKTRARVKGASPKQVKAAIETGLVESNLTNVKGGDADSSGWRQERASIYKDPNNLSASIDRFFDETAAVKDKYGRAGDLAAAVQRPAAQYRGRYQQQSGRADQLRGLAGSSSGSSGGGGASSSQGASSRTTTTTTPGVDNSALRGQAIQQFLSSKSADPVDFALQVRSLADVPGTKVTTTHSVAAKASDTNKSRSSYKAPSGAVAKFEGKQVAAWMVPALRYARKNGWNGTITSGVRTYADQARLYAQRASNPNPVAKPGTSNHEVGEGGGGAVDVTNPDALAKALKSYKGRKLKQGTAINDPVHFSATGN